VSPPDNAKNVQQSTVLTATFDEVLLSHSFRLTTDSGASVAGAVRCGSPCVTVTFDPSAPLRRDTTYHAVGVGTNRAGTARHEWSFHTAP
jgi:hypothetical protein